MTRQWTAEQIAAVAAKLWALDMVDANGPTCSDEEIAVFAGELLDACADESERRAKLAAEEAVEP